MAFQALPTDTSSAILRVAAVVDLPTASNGAVKGDIRYVDADDELYTFNGSTWAMASIPTGTVTGPVSSTDEAIARFDGTGGATLQNSVLTVSDTGVMSYSGSLWLHKTGTNSFFAGLSAGTSTTTGSRSTGLGRQALAAITSGSDNTASGYLAGGTITTGAQNTHVGSGADSVTAALTNAASFGYNAKVPASNWQVFGNASVSNWYLGSSSATPITRYLYSGFSSGVDGAGGDLRIGASQSTGTGAGGSLYLTATPASTVSGSTVNTAVTPQIAITPGTSVTGATTAVQAQTAGQTLDIFTVRNAAAADVFQVAAGGGVTLPTTGQVTFTDVQGFPEVTKIHIPRFNPGAFNQYMCWELPAAADVQSCILALLDARTVAHQTPTFQVLNPAEDCWMGFNWNGTNTVGNLDVGGYTDAGLAIRTGSNGGSGTPVEALRILGTNQYVGIGTALPSQKLEVNGGSYFGNGTGSQQFDFVTRGDYDALRLYSLNNGSGGNIQPPSLGFYRSTTGPSASPRFKVAGYPANADDNDGFTLSSPNSSVTWMSADENNGFSASSGATYSDASNVVMHRQRSNFSEGTVVIGTEPYAGGVPASGTVRSGQKNFNAADVDGSDLTIQAGRGTGSATGGGNLYFQTPDSTASGTSFQAYTSKLTLARSGIASFAADIKLATVGSGFYIKEGANATMGTAVMIAGAVTVNTTKVTANSRIYLTINVAGGVVGAVYENGATRVAGTSFDIVSTSVADTSTVAWHIVEPA